jgi:DNA-binding PadR family transcriptional regulator
MVQKKNDSAGLLSHWEDVYKKGLLTFWLLLFLHERPAYAYEAGAAIAQLSRETIAVDENSIYRALNRFETLGLVGSELRESSIGPRRRYYHLTPSGADLLAAFIRRNILIFENSSIRERIQAALREAATGKGTSS